MTCNTLVFVIEMAEWILMRSISWCFPIWFKGSCHALLCLFGYYMIRKKSASILNTKRIIWNWYFVSIPIANSLVANCVTRAISSTNAMCHKWILIDSFHQFPSWTYTLASMFIWSPLSLLPKTHIKHMSFHQIYLSKCKRRRQISIQLSKCMKANSNNDNNNNIHSWSMVSRHGQWNLCTVSGKIRRFRLSSSQNR